VIDWLTPISPPLGLDSTILARLTAWRCRSRALRHSCNWCSHMWRSGSAATVWWTWLRWWHEYRSSSLPSTCGGPSD